MISKIVVLLIIVIKLTELKCNVIPMKYVEKYFQDRVNLIESCENTVIGSNIQLSTEESEVNNILLKLKNEEFNIGKHNPDLFLPAQHFFEARDNITNSKVYKFIQKLPKGASLHTHDTAQVSEEFLFNLTYTNDLFYNIDNDGKIRLKFKTALSDEEDWLPIENARNTDKDFDVKLKNQLTLVVEDHVKKYRNVNEVWMKFQEAFTTIHNLIRYKPIFKQYLFQSFKELYEDNVKYVELRSSLSNVYDSNGKIYDHLEIAQIYLDVIEEFKKNYPSFIGAKIIYSVHRSVMIKILDDGQNIDETNTMKTFSQQVGRFLELREKYPSLVVGFDLVGQEDIGNPLVFFLPHLEYLKKNNAKFFFHAGETNWYGDSSDYNLFDAILLNTTRIGHGYAIVKHPKIQQLVKERGIAIEIAPISNQVLKLVDDFRNHPGNILLANGVPVVITNDDPSFWGAKGLSYDWYIAFMGMASKEADLRLLKQLAINSITYSCMNDQEKSVAFSAWQKDWDHFIKEVLLDK